LNMSLRQEQAETARLNTSLRQEQDERKAETAQLNRSLLLEEENRKDEKERFTAETRQLKAAITKEREERKAVVADLEGTIEQQGAKLEEFERDLRNAKEQHDNDVWDISELTQKLVPIHLRILLDYSRKTILESLGYGSWDQFRDGKNVSQLTNVIIDELHKENVVDPLSRETVEFLCSYNNIRRHGDYIAHNASQTEIKHAVMMKKNSQEGLQLEELYEFVFPSTPI